MTLILPTTPEGIPLPFLNQETQDPAELARLVAEWEKTHGRYSHVLFQCEQGILHAPRPVTSVLIPREQPVLIPETLDRDHVSEIDRALGGVELVRAEELPFFAWCLVPLVCVTNVPDDLWRGVPCQKIGVNTYLTGEGLLRAMDRIRDEAPPDPEGKAHGQP